MLNEAKLNLGVSASEYDPEIVSLIYAAARIIQTKGIVFTGIVKITATTSGDGTITYADESTITDPLIVRAILAYVKAFFGTPPDQERLIAIFDSLCRELAMTNGYTVFEPFGGEDE